MISPGTLRRGTVPPTVGNHERIAFSSQQAFASLLEDFLQQGDLSESFFFAIMSKPASPENSWSRVARAAAVIAIGAWVELATRLLPRLTGFLSTSETADDTSLFSRLTDSEFSIFLGSLIRMVGIGMLIPHVVKKAKAGLSLAWIALGLELVHLACRSYFLYGLTTRESASGGELSATELLDVPTSATVILNLGVIASYVGAMLLIKVCYNLASSHHRKIPIPGKNDGLILPAILIITTAIQLGLILIPTGSGSSSPFLIAGTIALIIGGLGRFLWLFLFGKLVWKYRGVFDEFEDSEEST